MTAAEVPELRDPADVLDRCAALEARDPDAAIALLVDAIRRRPSAALEAELVSLRHRRAGTPGADASAARPCAPGISPNVGPSGLPECRLDELTAQNVRAAIAEHGTLVVRGALDAASARELTEEIDRCWTAREVYGDPEAPGRSEAYFRPFSPKGPRAAEEHERLQLLRRWVRAAGGLLLCDSPVMQFQVLDLYTRLGLAAIVEEYLGVRPVLSANKCTLRRVEPDTVAGWHQDGAFLGEGIGAINLWLALTDCGRDAPGMDIVPRHFESIIETGGDGAYFDWAASDDVVFGAASDSGVVRPEFRAGDLVVFDELMMHRTAADGGMTATRYAIELWSFAPSAYPTGHVPMVW